MMYKLRQDILAGPQPCCSRSCPRPCARPTTIAETHGLDWLRALAQLPGLHVQSHQPSHLTCACRNRRQVLCDRIIFEPSMRGKWLRGWWLVGSSVAA